MAEFCQESTEDFLNPHQMVEDRRIVGLVGNRVTSTGSPSIAFAVKQYSMELQKAKIDIHLHYSDSMNNVQMTKNDWGKSCYQPILHTGAYPGAVQDTVMFLRNGQVWQLPLAGGEAVQVSRFCTDVECFKVFTNALDNSQWLAVVLEVYASLTPQQTVARDQSDAASGTSGVVYDRLMVRHWDRWGAYRKRHHVFVVQMDISSEGLLSADESNLRDLMFGMETDCPGKACGQGEEEFSVSPDGRWLSLACRRPETHSHGDMAWTTSSAVYLAEITAATAADGGCVMVSGDDWMGANNSPTFSPDGKKLAFLSMVRGGYESDKLQLRLLDMTTRQVVSVTAAVDLSFQSIAWGDLDDSGCESVLYCCAQHRAVMRIFRLTVSTGSAEGVLTGVQVMLGDDCSRSSPVLVFNTRKSSCDMYFLESSLSRPNEIKSVNVSGSLTGLFEEFCPGDLREGEKQMTSNTCCLLREVYCPCPEYTNGDKPDCEYSQHFFRGGAGELAHCWYMPPVTGSQRDSCEKTPLLLIVHGGPQVATLNTWHYRWNMAAYASRGYGVLAVNYHGSSGFGQEFVDSIHNDWGGKPYEDCLACVQYALRTFSYLDETRVAALGASYGGYMMNWINGHTNMFKCLVNHDGIFSLRSFFYSTEELWFPEWEFGLPWANEEGYNKWSPDLFVHKWSTPTLVIHGGKDHRISEAEGLATFTALQRQRVESKFLYFPDENHWVLKPMNSVKWHETVFEWLDAHLKQN